VLSALPSTSPVLQDLVEPHRAARLTLIDGAHDERRPGGEGESESDASHRHGGKCLPDRSVLEGEEEHGAAEDNRSEWDQSAGAEASGDHVLDIGLTMEKRWRHLDFFEHQAFLTARVPRVDCAEHGVHLVTVPWARAGSGFTLLMEVAMLTFAKLIPIAPLAKIAREHDTRVWRVIEHHVHAARATLDFSGVTKVGCDEEPQKSGVHHRCQGRCRGGLLRRGDRWLLPTQSLPPTATNPISSGVTTCSKAPKPWPSVPWRTRTASRPCLPVTFSPWSPGRSSRGKSVPR
jgi:hypothetical protein